MSDIPTNTCLLLRTTKIHIFYICLCSTCTVHVPNWVIVVLLHIFNNIFLFLVVANCSFVALGSNFCIHAGT